MRLPPIATLAAEARVAKNTMLAAVRLRASQGELTAAPGRGVVVNPAADLGRARPAPPSRSPGSIWERTATALRQDILNAAFAERELPSAASLTERYGVCSRTLRKALHALVTDGLVAVRRRRYTRAVPARPQPHATLLLLARGEERPEGSQREVLLSPISARTQENLRALEHYCVQHGIRLQHVPCFFGNTGLCTGAGPSELTRLLRERPVLGALVWTMALPEAWALTTVQRLRQAGLPVAVLDEVSTISQPEALAAIAGVRYYALACGTADGRIAGRYLLQLGHRRIAFISAWAEQDWAANRYRGVLQSFAEAGLQGAVELFAASDSEDVDNEQRVLAGVRAALNRTLATRVRHADGQAAPTLTGAPLFDDLRVAVSRSLLQRRLEPALRLAAARAEITAWVAANDAVGLQAFDFLRAKRIPVPGQLSLMGFDDSTEAAYRGLSSYSFNGPALVRTMVDFVLQGGGRPRTRPWQAVRAEGFVVQRATTGPAPERGMRSDRLA
jgi:DNA-binding LacI/PurR family transcriptional regulator/DNA-binding transcriptional regulator YhcF (GntR family)